MSELKTLQEWFKFYDLSRFVYQGDNKLMTHKEYIEYTMTNGRTSRNH
jgi:hypothetical protein